jgi:hypothetical protein
MENNENNNENQLYRTSKFEFKDIVAMIIAIFQVFVPIFIVALVILTAVVLFITKVWLN